MIDITLIKMESERVDVDMLLGAQTTLQSRALGNCEF
jgi:hypothetical protein